MSSLLTVHDFIISSEFYTCLSFSIGEQHLSSFFSVFVAWAGKTVIFCNGNSKLFIDNRKCSDLLLQKMGLFL